MFFFSSLAYLLIRILNIVSYNAILFLRTSYLKIFYLGRLEFEKKNYQQKFKKKTENDRHFFASWVEVTVRRPSILIPNVFIGASIYKF